MVVFVGRAAFGEPRAQCLGGRGIFHRWLDFDLFPFEPRNFGRTGQILTESSLVL
jgi:hypothetical protein